ncbi:hypothetical protein RchiOBHm_Chr6g0275181 [Rosa chinensis]|uniref:Uncharacterized protein n=1 Tax=Rosa chinensis TaxID=74649 RepID=A0A2P6PRX6_ROSCH|nr:hypothetical protein RchiOBHm_Chr6g0275181 [Rosa chinensis]
MSSVFYGCEIGFVINKERETRITLKRAVGLVSYLLLYSFFRVWRCNRRESGCFRVSLMDHFLLYFLFELGV